MARHILAVLIAFALALPAVVVVPGVAEAGLFDRLFGPPPPPPSGKKSRKQRNNGGLFGNPFLFGEDPYANDYQAPSPRKSRKPAAPSEPALPTENTSPPCTGCESAEMTRHATA